MKRIRDVFFVTICLAMPLIGCGQERSDDLIKNYREARGKIGLVQSLMMEGTVEIPAYGMSFDIKARFKEGGFYRFDQGPLLQGEEFNPGSVRILGNGEAFFVVDMSLVNQPNTISALPKEGIDLWTEIDADFQGLLVDFEAKGHQVKLLGTTTISDVTRHALEIILKSGNKVKVYLSGEDYRLIRSEYQSYHPQLGKVSLVRDYSNFKTVDGISFPTKIEEQRGDLNLIYEYNKIVLNPDFDDKLFTVDREIDSESPELTNDEVLATISAYVSYLNEFSPFTSSNEKIKVGLNQLWKMGQYKNVSNAQDLASQLSADIIDLTDDHHFGIDYNPTLSESLMMSEGDDVEFSETEAEKAQTKDERENDFYFQNIRIMEDQIGYFKLYQIPRIKTAKDRVDEVMQKMSEAKALIIDLRGNTGGADGFSQYVSSYFLPEGTLLFERKMFAGEETKFFAKDVPADRRLEDLPVYILVDGRTVSAGEQLSYLLQNHERATIVGETTFGAAHGSIDLPLANGLVALVPVGYEIHIQSGRDWEGTGVVPDVVCDPKDALEKAIELINR